MTPVETWPVSMPSVSVSVWDCRGRIGPAEVTHPPWTIAGVRTFGIVRGGVADLHGADHADAVGEPPAEQSAQHAAAEYEGQRDAAEAAAGAEVAECPDGSPTSRGRVVS
ncbi:hypothetical protein AB5J52_32575 [Streptomyces sp. R39]|uniref:Uncharacterized protein n=1 Tax=Streptomyces sp. R39 TaxID=3238631 RepID=A0AB39QT14_9ACTN